MSKQLKRQALKEDSYRPNVRSGSRAIRDSKPRFQPSASFGPYVMWRRIGAGGMGTVYLACDDRHAGAHQLAAIKIIHPHLAEEPEFVDMFFDEADIASRIEHPHVVRTFDYGQVDGTPYLAMEYLRGESFARLYRALAAGRCPWSIERASALVARAVADACNGVHAVHELVDRYGVLLGVVHRDVSPQNLFLTHQGVVKVLDFGTVKAAHQRHHTRTGFIKGKCAYVAPEILLTQPFDRRSDVWSLGVMLWELLTRERLFYKENEALTLRGVLEHDPVPPSQRNRSLPAIYDDVVMTALRRDPEQRFANALDFARALESALIAQNQLVDFGALAEWRQTLHPTVVALDDVLEREPDTVMRSEETQPTVTAMETPLEPMTEPSPIEPPFEPPVLDKRGSTRVHLLLSLVSAVISVLCFSGVAALAWNPRASSGWAGAWLSANAPALRVPRPAPAQMQQTPIGPFMLEVWSRDDDGQKKLIWQQSVDATTEGATTEGHQGHRSRRPPRVYGYSYDTLPHDL